MKFKKMITNREDLQQYLFVRGFLLTNRDDLDVNDYPFFGNWRKRAVGEYIAYTHKW